MTRQRYVSVITKNVCTSYGEIYTEIVGVYFSSTTALNHCLNKLKLQLVRTEGNVHGSDYWAELIPIDDATGDSIFYNIDRWEIN